MTNLQLDVEDIRLITLIDIKGWIRKAKAKLLIQKYHLRNSDILGEGFRYSHRIEILEGAINRLTNRYFKVLNS